jgi:hypothetical protein
MLRRRSDVDHAADSGMFNSIFHVTKYGLRTTCLDVTWNLSLPELIRL